MGLFRAKNITITDVNGTYSLDIDSNGNLSLGSGSANIGSVGLNAGSATVGNVKIAGDNARIATLDGVTYAQNTIDYAHHVIHSGSSYYLTYVATVADAADIELRFATPNTTKWSHFTLNVTGTGETDVDLFEATSLTHVGGNALTARNRDRNSANTSGMTICHTPAGSGDGTNIAEIFFGLDAGSGVNRQLSGGAANSRSELILKQNTAYLLRVASGTDGNRITVVFDWYEHTSKE